MMASKNAERLWVSESFADSLDEEYQKAKKGVEKLNKNLSFIQFTDFYAKAIKSEQKELIIQPIKTGRRTKNVLLDII